MLFKPIDISVGDGESNGQITSIEYELFISRLKTRVCAMDGWK